MVPQSVPDPLSPQSARPSPCPLPFAPLATHRHTSAPHRSIGLAYPPLVLVHRVPLSLLTRCSWENGTKSEAILEWTYPTLSVFTSTGNPFPGAGSITSGQISQIIDIAQTTLQNRPASNTSAAARGGSSLLQDDAAGDPASLGIAVLLANLTTGDAQVNGVGYGDAATQELNYLLYDVPRVSGACDDEASCELWLYVLRVGRCFFLPFDANVGE